MEQGTEQILHDIGFVGFWKCDFVTGQIWADDMLCRFFEVTPADGHSLIFEDFMRRVHPDDYEKAGPGRCTIVGPDGIGVVEYRIIGSDGAVRWVLCRAAYERTEAGALLSGQGIAFNTTASKVGELAAAMPKQASGNMDRVADLLLRAKQEAEPLQSATVGQVLDLALVVVGRLLARDLLLDVEEGAPH